MGVDWSEVVGLMEVSAMFYIMHILHFTSYGRHITDACTMHQSLWSQLLIKLWIVIVKEKYKLTLFIIVYSINFSPFVTNK